MNLSKNLEDLVIDVRVACEGGGRLAPCRRPPEVAVCMVIWTVECPIRMCRITCGEICGVNGCVNIFIRDDTIKFKWRSKCL